MFIAKNSQGVCISSQLARKNEQYFCLECEQLLVVRKSKTGRQYFAHRYYHQQGGEGSEHKAIKKHLQLLETALEFEQVIGNCRADVVYQGEVLEIQVSPIQQRQVKKRQLSYGEQLHWLLGSSWERPEKATYCLDRYGKLYRYHQDYCECYSNFHPLTKQRSFAIRRIICWESFFHELQTSRNYCLSYQQFFVAICSIRQWRQVYSWRYAKVEDEIAQTLYRWGMRAEQLPDYVGLPIPIVQAEQVLPLIWQGECCQRLAQGERLEASKLSWKQQFYLDVLAELGVCQKKTGSYQNYQRNEYTIEQLYQAYRLIWQMKPWPV